METFTFTGFDDLVSVNWFQGGGGAPGDQTHQFDNIVVVFDSDGDGISDADDACPDSDTRPTVVIGDCDSGVENTLFADGCTLSDLISQIAAASSSEAEFVRGVHELLRDLGLPAKDRQKILKCARQ